VVDEGLLVVLAALLQELERRIRPARPRELAQRDAPVQLGEVPASEMVREIGGRQLERGGALTQVLLRAEKCGAREC
jgi:hypothetical protein